MDAYDLHEARFIQYYWKDSAANDTSVTAGPVPAGKVWTIIGAGYIPSAAETKIVWWSVRTPAWVADGIAVSIPFSVALSATQMYPLLEQGMELKLYPGESIRVHRDSATAGSTMSIGVRYIESDLPYYAYKEPQRVPTEQKIQHIAPSRYRAGGGAAFRGGGIVGGGHGGSSGGGGSEPV